MFGSVTPSICRSVVFFSKTRQFNNHPEQPAVITKVWGTGPASAVNVKVLPDCGTPFDACSMFVYESLEAGLQSGNYEFCYWPPRA